MLVDKSLKTMITVSMNKNVTIGHYFLLFDMRKIRLKLFYKMMTEVITTSSMEGHCIPKNEFHDLGFPTINYLVVINIIIDIFYNSCTVDILKFPLSKFLSINCEQTTFE